MISVTERFKASSRADDFRVPLFGAGEMETQKGWKKKNTVPLVKQVAAVEFSKDLLA